MSYLGEERIYLRDRGRQDFHGVCSALSSDFACQVVMVCEG